MNTELDPNGETYPTRRHRTCDNIDCATCIRDHSELQNYLSHRLGKLEHYDSLREYRQWLDESEIPAEVMGWASPQAFNSQNIEHFIQTWLNPEA